MGRNQVKEANDRDNWRRDEVTKENIKTIGEQWHERLIVDKKKSASYWSESKEDAAIAEIDTNFYDYLIDVAKMLKKEKILQAKKKYAFLSKQEQYQINMYKVPENIKIFLSQKT